ncbi:MAG: hypothetical protein U9O98_01850 [Asgard group archaeon]|nr:hypothetical protein [Asgard group archaeon]
MKIQYYLLLVIAFVLGGVLFWYLLAFLNVSNATEYGVFIVILLITGLLIYALHGKGVLAGDHEKPLTAESTSHEIKKNYKRKHFKTYDFKQRKYCVFKYARKKYHSNFESHEFSKYDYQRNNFRS